MNGILALPLESRLAILFVVGLCAGSLINLGVYRLAYGQRSISPWSRPDPAAGPRRWFDRLPIVGWLGLRREVALHGPGFWIRPLVVELAAGVGFAALYWWEIDQQGLLFEGRGIAEPSLPLLTMLHAEYVCHAILVSLMLLSSLIDADEKTIPDAITVPGTLFGLLAAMVYPYSLLPVRERLADGVAFEFLKLASPHPWPATLNDPRALALALGCWWLWCVALMPRVWYGRHGWRRALGIFVTHLTRSLSTWLIAGMGLVGSLVVVAAWKWGGSHWAGLLTALVGMVASGGVVWLVRIIGSAVLGREAMGFGDVTLMGMIGALLGWQAALIVFFLAPFAGLAIGLTILILRRESEIAYGPFLCLAALVTIVRWPSLWYKGLPLFEMGLAVPSLLLGCMLLLAILLWFWQKIKALVCN